MATSKSTKRRRLDQLHEHPAQQVLFGDLPDHEIKELAASIARDGLKHPVEILPDGTVVAGHQRLRAVRLLGRDDVEVVIRADLADDPDAAEAALIADNLVRRQLGKLATARSYSRLMELEDRRAFDLFDKRPRVNLAVQMAKRLGCSRRNLDRYLAVLRTPVEVQRAFDDGAISLVSAARVAAMPVEQQECVAAAIRNGSKPKQAVAQLLHAGQDRPKNPVTALRRFLAHIQQAVEGLDGSIPAIKGMAPVGSEQALVRGRSLITELLKHVRARNRTDGHVGQRLQAVVDELNQFRRRRR